MNTGPHQKLLLGTWHLATGHANPLATSSQCRSTVGASTLAGEQRTKPRNLLGDSSAFFSDIAHGGGAKTTAAQEDRHRAHPSCEHLPRWTSSGARSLDPSSNPSQSQKHRFSHDFIPFCTFWGPLPSPHIHLHPLVCDTPAHSHRHGKGNLGVAQQSVGTTEARLGANWCSSRGWGAVC